VPKCTRTRLIVLTVSCGLTSCSGTTTSPTAPSTTPSAPSSVAAPEPAALSPAPTVTAITPQIGSVDGSAWGAISGAGFEPGARVTFGGVPATVSVRDSATILFWTPPRAAGTVDVIVTNPNGQPAVLAQGFTFASADSMDLNGTWLAHAGDEYDTEMRIVIKGDALRSVTCGTETISFAGPSSISQGEFSAVGEDGQRISGRIVSPLNAVGTISVAPCADRWWAEKR
jgi:hypothetical protein